MRLAAIARVATSLVLIAGCGVTASSCSSGAPSADTSAAAAEPISQSSTATVPLAATAGTVSPDPSGGSAAAKCDMLTPADVQFLMTDKASGPKVSPTGTDNDGQLCDFNNAAVDETVEVLVLPSSDPTFGYAAQKNEKPGAVSLNGVGAQAFREADDYDPIATGHGVTCSVSASIDDVPAAAKLIVGGHSITLTRPNRPRSRRRWAPSATESSALGAPLRTGHRYTPETPSEPTRPIGAGDRSVIGRGSFSRWPIATGSTGQRSWMALEGWLYGGAFLPGWSAAGVPPSTLPTSGPC